MVNVATKPCFTGSPCAVAQVLRTRMQADAAAGTLQGSTATLRMLLKEGGTRCAGCWHEASAHELNHRPA